MPYFVYRISPERKLSLIQAFDKYKDARELARSTRAAQDDNDQDIIKMVFAETQQKARSLIGDRRTGRTDGDD